MKTQYQQDKYYASAYNLYGSDDLMKNAGWINEIENNNGGEIDKSLDLLTTPLGKLSFSKDKINKILLTTGSFGPFHNGHLNMLNQAKRELEDEGFHVAGGYISPSHDSYVSTKDNMDLSIYDRIDYIESFIEKEDWLMLDKYESLHTPIPINFTTVIERLHQYILKHLGIDADIVYVFGGDNIDFSYAFVEFGEFVCVSREKGASMLLPNFHKTERHRFIYSEDRIVEQSSSKIRTQERNEKITDKKNYYLIRDDISESISFNIYENSINELAEIIQYYSQKDIVIMDTQEQLSLLSKKLPQQKTVSLDLYYKGNINLNLCRLFDISDHQSKPLKMVFRDGEIDSIEGYRNNNITLIDDDKASGQTVTMVKEMLSQYNIAVDKEIFLNNIYIENKGLSVDEIYDIVDARDFILGANYGGLCVLLPSKDKARSIYTYPYVNLKTRAKIDTKYHRAFSLDIWKWNKKIFSKNEKLKTLCTHTQNLMKYIGFNEESLILDVCEWHIKKLEGSQ